MIQSTSIFQGGLVCDIVLDSPLLATAPDSEAAPMILAGVLFSLVFIYLASKLGGELSRLVDLPPVLGELVAGVLVGLVFAGIGAASGVLDKPLQVAIIIMVILTTFVAPPLLRFAFKTESDLVEEPDLVTTTDG